MDPKMITDDEIKFVASFRHPTPTVRTAFVAIALGNRSNVFDHIHPSFGKAVSKILTDPVLQTTAFPMTDVRKMILDICLRTHPSRQYANRSAANALKYLFEAKDLIDELFYSEPIIDHPKGWFIFTDGQAVLMGKTHRPLGAVRLKNMKRDMTVGDHLQNFRELCETYGGIDFPCHLATLPSPWADELPRIERPVQLTDKKVSLLIVRDLATRVPWDTRSMSTGPYIDYFVAALTHLLQDRRGIRVYCPESDEDIGDFRINFSMSHPSGLEYYEKNALSARIAMSLPYSAPVAIECASKRQTKPVIHLYLEPTPNDPGKTENEISRLARALACSIAEALL